MGWMSGWNSRKELVEHLTCPQTAQTNDGKERKWIVTKKVFRGNNLWTILETWVDGVLESKGIVLFMMKRFGHNDWGYKDVCETSGPTYTNCPVSWLDEVPDPGSFATDWRAAVRQGSVALKSFKDGQRIKFDFTVRFSDGGECKEFTVEKYHRLTRFRRPDGVLCRLTRRMQQEAKPA
jgi:hypothetical protein